MTTLSRRHVHTEVLSLRWGDMDAAGHVNNTVYFRYMEEVRVRFFHARGLSPGGAAVPAGAAPVVVNASCSFLKPLVYPGDVEVRMYIGEVGRASMMTWYELRPSYDPAVVYAQGEAKTCFIDTALGRSIPLPALLRALAGS